jgi:hypothetical protein
MNQNSHPTKGREEFPAVPPLLIAVRSASSDGTEAIGSLNNAWVAFRASSEGHIHPDGSGGNFAGNLPGWVSVYARCFPVGFIPTTFLFQSLYFMDTIIGKYGDMSRPNLVRV